MNYRGVLMMVLLGSWFLPEVAGAAPKSQMVDRMIIEVNSFPFSQRQLEIYLTLKHSLLKKSNGDVALVNQNNWEAFIEEFRIDMLIEQEAQRLNTFQASPAQIDVAEQFIVKKRTQDGNLDNFLKYRNVSHTKVRQVLASILRVRGFILNRDKQNTPNDTVAGKTGDILSQEWIHEMEQRLPYRYFEGAHTWQPLKSINASGGTAEHDR